MSTTNDLENSEEVTTNDEFELVPPEVREALRKRGYATLTAVQKAVLDPALQNHDLRISSQTGSGKTLAIALVVAESLRSEAKSQKGTARPRAIVIEPTRELAAQVQGELSWALAGLGVKVAVVAGGASYFTESRALATNPSIVVGTPGRLFDHLDRGGIATDNVATVVLDEADQMLDLGFREALESILGMMPKERRTHLVSATFSREVTSLAKRYQHDAIAVEGTRLGAANIDIDHIIHLLSPAHFVGGVINILLANPGEQTLVFARTRAEVAHLTEELQAARFAAASLSGEMAQDARNRALAAFRSGQLRVLVATDVAARGIDVQNVARVIHLTPPGDPEGYTHRSGRTGRAGRKGASVLVIAPGMLARARRMLDIARITPRIEPIPTAKDILSGADDRLYAELIEQAAQPDAAENIEPRLRHLAKRLLADGDAELIVANLLSHSQANGPTTPRDVKPVMPNDRREPARSFSRDAGPRDSYERPAPRAPSGPRAPNRELPSVTARSRELAEEQAARPSRAHAAPAAEHKPRVAKHHDDAPPAEHKPRAAKPHDDAPPAEHKPRAAKAHDDAPPAEHKPRAPKHHDTPAAETAPKSAKFRELIAEAEAPPPRARTEAKRSAEAPAAATGRESSAHGWVPFSINWGEQHGADPRRLLAVLCRRGDIQGKDVGSIRINQAEATFEVAASIADHFETHAARRDARDPGLRILRGKKAKARTEPTPARDRDRVPDRAPTKFSDRPRKSFSKAKPVRGK